MTIQSVFYILRRAVMKIAKIFLFVVVVFATLFIFSTGSIQAEDQTSSEAKNLKMTEKIDSYELFWPIVAGKTLGDSGYFLKTFKESLREALIFGKVQKSDYQLFLTTKRIIEAEKLIINNRSDLVLKTLDKAIAKLSSAKINYDKAKNNSSVVGSSKDEINNKLSNLEKFTPQLIINTDGTLREKLLVVLELIKNFKSGL